MIELLYRDEHILVCLKPAGVLAQEGQGQNMPELLRQQLQCPEVYPVHRLDKAVGGVMVYALSQKAAAGLSRAVQERTLEKTYLAIACGTMAQEGVWEDLLFHDKGKNKTYVVDRKRKGVKDAKLSYTVLEEMGAQSLVHIKLYTGRTHQIRVQFASRKCPLVGDGRYGAGASGSELGLWSYSLRFAHPVTGEPMFVSHRPPHTTLWDSFSEKHLQTAHGW